MTDELRIVDQEPAESEEAPSAPPTKARRSFAKLRRELTDEDLASPVVARMLLDEVERLDRESSMLAVYRDRYYEADKQCGILEEQQKKRLGGEIIFGVCLTIGAALVGYAPALWEFQPAAWIAIVLGGGLIVGGVGSRMVQR